MLGPFLLSQGKENEISKYTIRTFLQKSAYIRYLMCLQTVQKFTYMLENDSKQ
jgi:hypothetical protein